MRSQVPGTINFSEIAQKYLSNNSAVITREEIKSGIKSLDKWIVVLDDDPTGSQAVHDVPIITSWSNEDIRWAFEQEKKYFFILTNLRSLDKVSATKITVEIAERVSAIASEIGIDFTFISRGDSTLRGHYPLEIDILKKVALQSKNAYDLVLFAPAYLEAGRMTLENIQWVKTENRFIPVSESVYAQDSTFGFKNSNLIDYILEKSNGEILESSIYSLTVENIRSFGVAGIVRQLHSFPKNSTVIVNALDENDLNVVAAAAIEVEGQGRSILYRAAPSFVAARLGIVERAPLSYTELFPDKQIVGNGLVVVGSHVEITNAQVSRLKENLSKDSFVEIEVEKLLTSGGSDNEIQRCIKLLLVSLKVQPSILLTSRLVVSGVNEAKSLEISNIVASALVKVTSAVMQQSNVSWVIAKGGITSSDMLTKVFQMKRARVLGQLFSGIVSVFQNEMKSTFLDPKIPVVIFAGNVGTDESLVEALKILQATP